MENSTPICTSNFKLIDGLPNLPKNMIIVTAELYNEGIFFWQTVKHREQQSPIILKIESILSVEYMSEKEIIEKSKSVAGRATAGALLLGPVGAIVGGMSGIGNTKKTKTHLYYVIHYMNSQGSEAIITLEVGCMGCHDSAFNKALKSMLPKENNDMPTYL